MVGISGGVDQVQILVDVGVGDGGAVHGREVLEPRGRDPVAAVVRARAAALGRVAASNEGAGFARVEEGLPRAVRWLGVDVLSRDAPLSRRRRRRRERAEHLDAMLEERRRHAVLEVRGPRPRRVPRRLLAPAGSGPGASHALRCIGLVSVHLDEMLTLGRYLRVTSAIDAGSSPLTWPSGPRRRTPASVVARLSGRPRRYRFRGFIRARTRPRSDARPPRGTRSSSGRIGHRIPIQRVGLVLESVTTGGFYGSHATGGPSAEPEPSRAFLQRFNVRRAVSLKAS